MKKPHGGARVSSAQIDPLKTADKLAMEHGVSSATVKRAGKLAEDVAEALEMEPDILARGEAEFLKVAKSVRVVLDSVADVAAVLIELVAGRRFWRKPAT